MLRGQGCAYMYLELIVLWQAAGTGAACQGLWVVSAPGAAVLGAYHNRLHRCICIRSSTVACRIQTILHRWPDCLAEWAMLSGCQDQGRKQGAMSRHAACYTCSHEWLRSFCNSTALQAVTPQMLDECAGALGYTHEIVCADYNVICSMSSSISCRCWLLPPLITNSYQPCSASSCT
jgi:hypothetical protein